MREWQTNNRRDVAITDINALVPKDHLVRKIEKVMDYEWLHDSIVRLKCKNGVVIQGIVRMKPKR